MPWKEANLMNVKREFIFKSFNKPSTLYAKIVVA